MGHSDDLRFRFQTEKHELSHLYEDKIRNRRNANTIGKAAHMGRWRLAMRGDQRSPRFICVTA